MRVPKIVNKAVQIGNELISKAISTPRGICWETQIQRDETSLDTVITADIYSGASGIALFFLELFRATKQQKYLVTAQKAMDWVVWYGQNENWNEYSFYVGRTGAAYVLVKLFKITGNKKYFDQALAISKGGTKFLDKKPVCDLLLGVSGTLLGLLHLYAVTKQKWILKDMRANLDSLLARVNFGPEGIYWDRSGDDIHGLCSFSHGASGIGFVLLEMGKFFSNPAYYWLAKQAFDYEDYYYDKKKHNWPDFRKLYGRKDLFVKAVEEYNKKNYKYFSSPSFTYAWCHGSPGIGLARLRYKDLTGEKNWLLKVKDSQIPASLETKKRNELGLCHGLTGLIEIARLQSTLYKKDSNRFLNERQSSSLVTDLFNGLAGIGYGVLKSLRKDKFSVLYPVLKERYLVKSSKVFDEDIGGLKMILIKQLFPQTLAVCSGSEISKLQKSLNQGKNQRSKNLVSALTGCLELLLNKGSEAYLIFEVEKKKIGLDNRKSDVYLYVSQYVHAKENERILKLSEHKLNKIELKLVPEVKLIKGNYILRQTYEGVKMIRVSKFYYEIFFSHTK